MSDRMIDLRWWLISHSLTINNLEAIYTVTTITALTFFIIFSLADFADSSQRNQQRAWTREAAYIFSALLVILLARWPSLMAASQNPDESQFVAAAIKLSSDALFWRSVDTGSSGPFNIIPLMLPSLAGVKIEHASSRLVGLLMMSSSACLLYLSLRFLYNQRIAKISLIPVFMTIALARYFDFIEYTSEQSSIFLTSLSLMLTCLVCSGRLQRQGLPILVIGLCLGAVPLAKPQAIPIAISVAIILWHHLWFNKRKSKNTFRKSMIFLGGISILPLATLAVVIGNGTGKDAWNSYIQQNIFIYSGINNQPQTLSEALNNKFLTVTRIFSMSHELAPLLILTILAMVLWSLFLLKQRQRHQMKAAKSAISTHPAYHTSCQSAYALIFLSGSLVSTLYPSSGFAHYLLFLIIPCGLFNGVALGEAARLGGISNFSLSTLRGGWLFYALSMAILATSSLQFSQALATPNPYLRERQNYAQNHLSPLARVILTHTSTNDTVAIWGWAPNLYVESARPQATRDGNILWQITPGRLQEYYQKRYISDFLKSNPILFIDAVAPSMFGLHNRKANGHDAYPDVAALIQSRYSKIDEVDGVRIYKRKN